MIHVDNTYLSRIKQWNLICCPLKMSIFKNKF